jgi:hypothetical protein
MHTVDDVSMRLDGPDGPIRVAVRNLPMINDRE